MSSTGRKVMGVAASSDPGFVLAPGTAARLGLWNMQGFTVENNATMNGFHSKKSGDVKTCMVCIVLDTNHHDDHYISIHFLHCLLDFSAFSEYSVTTISRLGVLLIFWGHHPRPLPLAERDGSALKSTPGEIWFRFPPIQFFQLNFVTGQT